MDGRNSYMTPNVSVITKIEVLGYNAPKQHEQLLSDFMNDAVILDFKDEIISICIDIRKSYKIKLPDAMIAATALAYDMVLLSRNTSDFKSIESLRVIDPHNITV